MSKRKEDFKPAVFAGKICQQYTLMYRPDDSLYEYIVERGVWQPIHSRYIEAEAMRMLGTQAKTSRLSDIRKLVETSCVIPTNRDFNELNGHLNLRNGMFNLETRHLHHHDRDFLSTIQLPVTYNQVATCPRWLEFLEEIFEGDDELVDLAQEFMGYSLVPDTRYEKALLFIGEGANGKSTLIRVWESIVGPENISSVTLAGLQNEFHRVTLLDKLLNITAEVNPMTVDQSDYFKRIVTGDLIDAAHKGKPVFTFRPFARLVFAMNRMPRVKDTSHGFYRRLLMVPFNRVFEGEAVDRQLSKKLLAELDGIFLWALRGLDRLYANDGFTEAVRSRQVLEDYKRANNPVVAFVLDQCELAPEADSQKETLFNKYKEYSENWGYVAASAATFFRELYAAFPDLKVHRPRDGAERERRVKGIKVVRVI